MSANTIYVPLNDVKNEIWESDLLVFRSRTGSCYRVAKAARWDDELFCLEVRRFQGVVAVPLAQLVEQFSGKIDVYEVNPEDQWKVYDRKGATRHLKKTLFSKSDRRNVLLETFLNLFLRLLSKPKLKSSKTPYCADAIRQADRLGGGVDPIPKLISTGIEPGDLATSPLYRYRFTLQ